MTDKAKYEEFLSIAEQAESEGDYNTAADAYELAAKYKPLFKAAGVPETALQAASGLPAMIASGYAGMLGAVLPGEQGQGARWQQATQEAMTFEPRSEAGQSTSQWLQREMEETGIPQTQENIQKGLGEAGYQIGGPVGGAIGESLPAAGEAALGIFGMGKSKGMPEGKAIAEAERAEMLRKEYEAAMNPEITEEGVQASVDLFKDGKVKKPETLEEMLGDINADPEFYEAYERLSMTSDPLVSYASRNPQFRQMEQGLKSIPGSKLSAEDIKFIEEVKTKGDEYIEMYGGSLDKGQLSMDFRENMGERIDQTYAAEEKIWKDVKGTPGYNTMRVRAQNTLELIEQMADEVGGLENLPPSLYTKKGNKGLYNKLSGKQKTVDAGFDYASGGAKKDTTTTYPTYGFFDLQRQNIGSKLGKKGHTEALSKTGFSDVETGMLKRLYGAMKKDQMAIADERGMKGAVESANLLTVTRKRLEDNAKKLLGNDFQNDIMPVVEGKVKRLINQGDVERFDRTMNMLTKDERRTFVTTAINSIIRGRGSDQQAMSINQFVKTWGELERQPAIKNRLYRELDPEMRQAMDDLYIVAKGVDKATKDELTTGKVLSMFDESGLLGRMMGMAGRGTGAAAGAKAGPGGAMAGAELGGNLVERFIASKSSSATKTRQLLADNDFKALVRQSAAEGIVQGAAASRKLAEMEKAIMKSKKYKQWSETLPVDRRLELMTGGLVAYLLQPPVTAEGEAESANIKTGFDEGQMGAL